MRVFRSWRFWMACFLVSLSGCQAVGGYFKDRGSDFADLFFFEAGYGLGLHVDAQGTDFIHPGIGYSQVQKAALRGRDPYWTRDREIGLPASTLLLIPAIRDKHWHRLGHWHVSSLELRASQDSWLHRFDSSVGATLAFLQLRAGFSVGQFIDFLGGIVGLDPAGDDRGFSIEPSQKEEREWFNGDAHVHISPPDSKSHVHKDLTETAALAESENSQWLLLTPHLWPSAGRSDAKRHPMMKALANYEGPALLPGWEYSRNLRPGHGLMVFRKLADFQLLPGWSGDEMADYWLTQLPENDLFFAQAHPYSAPLNIPFVRISKADLSWSQRRMGFKQENLGETWATKTWRGHRYWERRIRSKTEETLSLGSAQSAALTIPTAYLNKAYLQSKNEGDMVSDGSATGTVYWTVGAVLWSRDVSLDLQDLTRALRQLSSEMKGSKELNESLVRASERAFEEFKKRSEEKRDFVLRWALGAFELRFSKLNPTKKITVKFLDPSSAGQLMTRAAFERMDRNFDGLEVYNHTVHMAELALGVPEEERHITKAFAKLDKAVARRRRPITPLGGADNHRELMPQTSWILSRSNRPEHLFDALKAGRSVVGSNLACDFSARCDDTGDWRAIGARLKGKKTVSLRWRGRARLIVDGQEWGSADGGVTLKIEKDFHFYRIIQDLSHSGYIVVTKEPQ